MLFIHNFFYTNLIFILENNFTILRYTQVSLNVLYSSTKYNFWMKLQPKHGLKISRLYRTDLRFSNLQDDYQGTSKSALCKK